MVPWARNTKGNNNKKSENKKQQYISLVYVRMNVQIGISNQYLPDDDQYWLKEETEKARHIHIEYRMMMMMM